MSRAPSFTVASLLAALVGAVALTSCATNLEADRNVGGVTVTDNEVGGDPSCEENTPAPHGDGNHVSENHEDQCRGL